MKTLSEIIELARELPGRKVSLAGADEEDALIALEKARSGGLADGVLVGDKDKIAQVANKIDVDLSNYEIVHEGNPKNFCKTAVSLVNEGKADVFMKGLVSTADFMRAVLDKKVGLLSGGLLSHLAIFEIPSYHKLLAVTDAAININPSLGEKVKIIANSVSVLHKLGVENPKVACVCAVEKVNPGKMPCTEDAAILAGMNKTGIIKGCMVDGPLGLDNAINADAAKIKKIESEVAGDADLVIFPEIVSANVMYKSLSYLNLAPCAAIVVGTSAPVVLTSRADSEKVKFSSLALGIASS